MTVAAAVGAQLAGLGADHLFGLVGSGNFHLATAMRAAAVTYVAARHECAAVAMADAYARTSGRPGLATVHQGPGLTNAMTALTEAAKSRTPLLLLAAATGTGAVRSNFRIDQAALAGAVGAVPERVHTAASAAEDVRRAWRRAMHERRTVLLDLPLDVQAAPAPSSHPAALPEPAPPPRPAPAAAAALAAELAAARRPVFVIGRGGRRARAEIVALADACGALLATSAVAHGLLTGHPWALGISGGFASPLAAELIAGADLVVGWGCSLGMWTTRHGSLIGPSARVVQVDTEAAALGAHRDIDLGVLGDAAQTARDTLGVLDTGSDAGGRAGYRDDALRERIAAGADWRAVPYTDASEARTIDPRTLTIALDRMLPAERVVTVDSGNFMGYPSVYLPVPDASAFCFAQAFQSVGLGLAGAVGAALANPGRLPVAALGDGGALMAIGELETVVRLGLPMVVVIYDDAAYGAEVHHFAGGADLSTVRFGETDLAAIGAGFGCAAVTVRRPADLSVVADWAAGPMDRPLVIDAKVTSMPSWWLEEAFRGH